MKKTLENIGILVLVVFFAIFMLGFYVGSRYTDNQIGIDSLQKQIDSLRQENFVNGVEAGRWEVTMEWYREVNPKEAKKIEDWRSHNTE
jgi:hypothetical protein